MSGSKGRLSHHRKRGYILVATTLAIPFLLGVCGLAIDIGRMYIAKGEAQAYADSASLAAARQLDNTTPGITRAKTAAGSDTDKWRFDTAPFTSVSTTFGTSAAGPFTATPPEPPTGYRYAQVVVGVKVPMYLMSAFSGPTSQVNAGAVAGQSTLTSIPGGEFPFSPYTRKGYPGAVPDDTTGKDPFGYKVGDQYTLRWGAPGDRSTCGTDGSTPSLASNGKIRGYCCVAGNAATIRQSIASLKTDPVTLGDGVEMDNGAKDTEMTSIADRVNLDNDKTSSTYSQYRASGTGNGTRVVVVVVNGGPPKFTAIGFAAFFLLPASDYSKLNGNQSACAEYIGAWTQGVSMPAPGGSGAWKLRLYR